MICCLLVASMVGAFMSLPRRLFAIRAPASVDWRPGSAADLRNPSRLASIRNAMTGFRALLAGEVNFRIHVIVASFVVALGFWFRLGPNDWRWLATAITFVLLAEALNTGIERACDAITTERHPMIGMAKDIASTGVLIAVLAAIIIGALTFSPYIVLAWADLCAS